MVATAATSPTTFAPKEGEEVWEIAVDGALYLRVTAYNRFGQMVEDEMMVGPKKRGHQFRIRSEDREENQRRCASPQVDPFRNGMLVRRDADQNEDPDTASPQALTTEQLMDLLDDTHIESFKRTCEALDEVPLRRLLDLGRNLDASHKQIDFLEALILDRYGKGQVQPSTLENRDPKAGERLFS